MFWNLFILETNFCEKFGLLHLQLVNKYKKSMIKIDIFFSSAHLAFLFLIKLPLLRTDIIDVHEKMTTFVTSFRTLHPQKLTTDLLFKNNRVRKYVTNFKAPIPFLCGPLHKKWSFPLMISSENITKSTGNCWFGYIYWRNPYGKTSFFVQWTS